MLSDDDSIGGIAQERWRTAAREIREEAELFAQVIESMPDGLVLVDNEGKIVFVNKQAELFFGYSRHELVGQEHAILIPESQRDIHDHHRIVYQRNPHIRAMGVLGSSVPLMGRHKDGSSFRIDIMLAPIIGRKGIYTVAMIRRSADMYTDTTNGRPK
jgi:PAS domain S-box-containing protein